MSNDYITLDTNFSIQSGFAFPSSAFVDEGIPIVRMSDLKTGSLKFENTKYVSSNWLDIASLFRLKEGDFVLGMSGSLSNYAKVTINDVPALLNQRVGRLVSKNLSNSYEYASYWLKSEFYQHYADIQGEGAAQKNISPKKIGAFKIRDVDKPIQDKIVSFLATIDQTIEKTEALIAKYQLIKAGLMQDLFTRGIGADGKLRPTREQAPELYYETKIGWIPKDWVCDEIKNFVTSAQYGVSISLSDEENGIPVLRMNNIKNNKFDVSDLKYSDSVEASTIKIREGDVLYNRTNSMEHVGKTAIWRNELSECSFASYLVRMNLKIDILLPEFFSHWMSQESSQISLRRYATPAVQQVNINPTNVQKVLIACPQEIAEQKIIFEKIDTIDSKIFGEEKVLFKLEKQKQGLMHDLLTGKKRVTVDQVEADHVRI